MDGCSDVHRWRFAELRCQEGVPDKTIPASISGLEVDTLTICLSPAVTGDCRGDLESSILRVPGQLGARGWVPLVVGEPHPSGGRQKGSGCRLAEIRKCITMDLAEVRRHDTPIGPQ